MNKHDAGALTGKLATEALLRDMGEKTARENTQDELDAIEVVDCPKGHGRRGERCTVRAACCVARLRAYLLLPPLTETEHKTAREKVLAIYPEAWQGVGAVWKEPQQTVLNEDFSGIPLGVDWADAASRLASQQSAEAESDLRVCRRCRQVLTWSEAGGWISKERGDRWCKGTLLDHALGVNDPAPSPDAAGAESDPPWPVCARCGLSMLKHYSAPGKPCPDGGGDFEFAPASESPAAAVLAPAYRMRFVNEQYYPYAILIGEDGHEAWDTDVAAGRYVAEADYDAALREIAKLREELDYHVKAFRELNELNDALAEEVCKAEAQVGLLREDRERLRVALERIVEHQQIVAPSMMTTTERIASDALASLTPKGSTE